MYAATVTALVVAALLAVPVARKRHQYRAVAAFLLVTLGVQFVREQFVLRVIRPAKAELVAQGMDPLAVPLPPAVVWAGHVEHSLYLGWVVGVAALAVLVFLRDEDRPMATVAPVSILLVGWATMTTIMVMTYPTLRGPAAEAKLYRPIEVSSVVIAIGAIWAWVRTRRSPQIEHVAAGLVVALQAMAGLTLLGRIETSWALPRAAYLVLYSVLDLIQGVFAWWHGSSRARS